MKKIILTFIILFSTSSLAGGGSHYNINKYSSAGDFYYNSVTEIDEESLSSYKSSSGRKTTDILIYDTRNNTQKMLFKYNKKKHVNRNIKAFLFERSYDDEKKYILFGKNSSVPILNNFNMLERPLKNKILIVNEYKNTEKDITIKELWSAEKNGEDLKLLTSFNSAHSWHLDVRNSVIRVVKKFKNKKIKIENIDW